jgi:trimeric autotransporter adhesin
MSHTRRASFVALSVLTFIVTAAGHAVAQGYQGGLRGEVKDSGGVIPGAEVTLTNDGSGVSRSTQTNAAGEYTFPNLAPGSYSLKIGLQGYRGYTQSGLRVGTQQLVTVDVKLEVGQMSEAITVRGESPIIETSTASTGTVLDTQALQSLPSPGRSAFLIGTTVPTVIPSGDTQFNRQQDQTNASLLSLGGGTRRGNNYTLDGVPITDLRNRASANPSIESLEDVKVQVHTYDAEMGRTGGGVFNTTLKSGTNTLHGTGFFQMRPIWGQTNNYFSEKAGLAKPNSPYYLGGGGVGGAILRNRTFFWFASENYHDVQTRNASVTMPTTLERAGDFSQTTNASGAAVLIYDPITGQPFAGSQIPASRINPVAAAMLKYLPLADVSRDNGSTNYTRTSLINNRFQQLYSGKVDHKLTDALTLSGFYLYNKTDEPDANYFGSATQTEPTRFADPLDYILVRRPKILALNGTWVTSGNSVLAMRFGMTRFPDNNTLSIPFDPSTLGFSPAYLDQVTLEKFPGIRIRGYDQFAGQTMGAINPTEINWKSTSANTSYARTAGAHLFKVGADFRKMGVDTYIPGDGAGFFDFDKDMTSSNGGTGGTTDGNAFASFLLGYPSSVRTSQISVSTPLNLYTYYYGGYVHDDWRVNGKLTLNYGLRVEHEDGLREEQNRFTVGFDPALKSALSSITVPADPIAGTPARQVGGGLLYAGVDGNKTTQGNQPAVKWSPRVGVVYEIAEKTVLRGGYGLYWAPFNYPGVSTSSSNYGQVGYTQNTILSTSRANPVSLTNPFPNGVAVPTGNALGALTNLDSNVSFVDQNRVAPRVQQFSVDLQRELPGGMALTATYMGARNDHLGLGGSNDTAVNLNQLDPKYLALGSALNDAVPNPFFGNPAVPLSLSLPATIARSRLLLPYPQYRQVNARQVTEGFSRYHAGVVELNKRLSHGIGGRFSYTYSVLKDNLVGESNFYTAVSPALPVNNYNYVASQPACAPGAAFTTACYDPRAEYGYSVLDVPHRVILAPIAELPFGKERRWANGGGVTEWILGGWMVSSIVNLQSGFPLNVQQGADARLSLGGATTANRPNLVSGTDLATSGSLEDRLATADHPTATWLNPAAFGLAATGTIGDAPRTITTVRTAGQYNIDAVLMKNVRFGGSKVAQVKIEVLNLLNRPNVRTIQGANTVGSSNFGQTTIQAGFMRITQIMFRFSF